MRTEAKSRRPTGPGPPLPFSGTPSGAQQVAARRGQTTASSAQAPTGLSRRKGATACLFVQIEGAKLEAFVVDVSSRRVVTARPPPWIERS